MIKINQAVNDLQQSLEELKEAISQQRQKKQNAEEKVLELKYVIKNTYDRLDNVILQAGKEE